jgi:hypothetical protein
LASTCVTSRELTDRANEILGESADQAQRNRATRACLRFAHGQTEEAARHLAELAENAATERERRAWLILGVDLLAGARRGQGRG